MADNLLIVESPAKAKTIGKYLGSNFKILASFGHVRDLPKKNGSVDTEHDFSLKYQLIARNKKHVDEILAAAKKSKAIYLASDPDREGDAIAWHLQEILYEHGLNKGRVIKRVTFNEITKPTVVAAVENPRDININLVEAQQSRLSLDYLIGFNVSPLLWRKIRPGLSAGRVQSPALRLICERELEIKSFVPEDYFGVHLHTHKGKSKFKAKLVEFAGKKLDTKAIKTIQDAQDKLNSMKGNPDALITKITKKQKKRNPTAPFITSSMLIESARQLGFATDKTTRVAQSLYEGVELNGESTGLITYMRTDSVQLSPIAIDEIREYIGSHFDKRYLPSTPNVYSSKSKNAQEAHEAIRPTAIIRTPASIKAYLSLDQYKLYELIWRRTLASQISSAIFDTTAVDIKLNDGIFRVNGMTVNFDGYMIVYQEMFEENANADDSDEIRLPKLEEGEILPVDNMDITAHQTEPKPRYTEASLIKVLEELGIGRPSTYPPIINTLKKREYVVLDKKRLVPTDVGIVVSKFLTEHLTRYVDLQFTANLEETLDKIAIGENARIPVLSEFWHDLKTTVTEKQNISRMELTSTPIGEDCPKCSKPLISRFGKYGRFIACSGYPECDYMRKIDKDGNSEEIVPPEEIPDRVCPKDGGKLLIRTGKYGKFISCANYPKCKHIEELNAPNLDNAVDCPECKKGKIVAKKGRFGIFYSCNNYPTCKTIFKYEPIVDTCTECSYPVLMTHTTKTKGTQHICPKCKHAVKI